MKHSFHAILILAMMIAFSCSKDSSVPADGVWVARFPDNKDGAVSFTFDDNPPSSFTIIAPAFTKYHFPATFFVIPDQIHTEEEWQAWRSLHDAGFEIGNHTMSHLDLREIQDTSVLHTQIDGAYEIIKSKIGAPPFSFAHPFHHSSELVDQIVFQKHFASRLSPEGFCHWLGVSYEIPEQTINEEIQTTIDKHGWLVIAGHGVDDGWKPISEHFLVSMLDYTALHSGNLCVETFEHLSKYKIEQERTKVTTQAGKDYLTISLTSDLDTATFNYPLTVIVDNNAYTGEIIPLPGTKLIDVTRAQGKALLKLMPNSQVRVLRVQK